jgi:hypothetical protein
MRHPFQTILSAVASTICLIHCAVVPFWTWRPKLFETVLAGGPAYAFMPIQPTGWEMLASLWAVGYKYNVLAAILMMLVYLSHRHAGSTWPQMVLNSLPLLFVMSILLEPWIPILHWVALLTSVALLISHGIELMVSFRTDQPSHT